MNKAIVTDKSIEVSCLFPFWCPELCFLFVAWFVLMNLLLIVLMASPLGATFSKFLNLILLMEMMKMFITAIKQKGIANVSVTPNQGNSMLTISFVE